MTSGRSSSNGLVLVIIAGLVVVAAGAAGWFLFNKSDPAVADTSAPEPLPEKPAGSAAVKPPPALDPASKVSASTDPPPKKDLPTREYYVDGKLIRDHRPEGTPPFDLPPVIRPPDARKVKPESINVVTKAMQLVMRECVASIPPEERTSKIQKMEGVFTIAIKDKVAKVVRSTVQLRDVRGSATDAAKTCIENKVLGVSEGVDEADLETYDISTSLRF